MQRKPMSTGLDAKLAKSPYLWFEASAREQRKKERRQHHHLDECTFLRRFLSEAIT